MRSSGAPRPENAGLPCYRRELLQPWPRCNIGRVPSFVGRRPAAPMEPRHRISTYADRRREEGGQIKTAWRGALRRAGVDPELTPHDLRHTWANWYYALHRDLLALKIEGLVISGAGREIRASPPGRARGSHPCFTGSIGTTLAPIPSKSAQIIDGITLIPLGALLSGGRGRRFKSSHSDHKIEIHRYPADRSGQRMPSSLARMISA